MKLQKTSSMRLLLFFNLILYFFPIFSFAQELNCEVKVITTMVQNTDPRVFKTMEKSIMEFMNNRKWTDDVFKSNERIDCSIILNITEEISTERFKMHTTIQAKRPVHGSSFNTPIIYIIDKYWDVTFTEFQPLDFVEGTHFSNLTSLLAYYAYIIIGLDYDSFSLMGGTTYFVKSQNIVNNAQNSAEDGWQPYVGAKRVNNRYWLVENLLNPKFDAARNASYKYHRLGLDVMSTNDTNGIKEIGEALKLLEKVNKENLNSMIVQNFMDTKHEEIINAFSDSKYPDKAGIVETLGKIDPTRASRYRKIQK